MMHQFNQTMDYLEQQLTGEVDMKGFSSYRAIPTRSLAGYFLSWQI